MIRFDVEDTGIGIPVEKQETIFEAFTQSDASTTRKYGGTGLGLTITQKLGQLLGGNLSVHSEPNRGSVFTLTISAEPEKVSAGFVKCLIIKGLRSDDKKREGFQRG